ncbi:hypothetical protein BH23DEI1_BH23DEI1_09440 [soil metagenome]
MVFVVARQREGHASPTGVAVEAGRTTLRRLPFRAVDYGR